MKFNKLLPLISLSSVATIPLASTSCALFGIETSEYKAFSETGIYTDQMGGSPFTMTRPDKVVDSEDCVCTFKCVQYNGIDTHQKLTKDNIHVYVSTSYQSENDGEITDYTFDEGEQKLTITTKFLKAYFEKLHKNKVSQAQSMIRVLITSPQINPSITWKDISDIVNNKDVDPTTYFMPSSWTYLKVNNKNHRVRIADVNRDTYTDGSGVAPFTFEFVDVLTNSDGTPFTTQWSNPKLANELLYQPPQTVIYRHMIGDVKDTLASALSTEGISMKAVNKTLMYNEYKSSIYVDDLEFRTYSFDCFLFALSALKTLSSGTYNNRINKQDSVYKIYQYKAFQDFTKTAAEGTEKLSYWTFTRIPCQNFHLRTSENDDIAYLASSNDSSNYVSFWDRDDVVYPIAPCFCL